MPKRAFSDNAICRRIFEWLSPLKLGNWLKIISIQGIPLHTAVMKMLIHCKIVNKVQWQLELPTWNISEYSMGGLKT
jgi:hypothetical protein